MVCDLKEYPLDWSYMREDLPYWLALVRYPKFGPVRIQQLQAKFPSMREAFFASANELLAAGIDAKLANQFVAERAHIDPEKEAGLLALHGVKALTVADSQYPEVLKEIHDPPAVLFYKGEVPKAKAIAVVGSRKGTRYGQQIVQELVQPLAANGVTIVSGLALGIDALAHQAALDAKGQTVAVLGSGLDEANIYPTRNRFIAKQITNGQGALISEFPIGTHPLAQNFPQRNRVIAGLSQGTLIIEAAAKSGSLITARLAMESGRDVFAVPGPINSPLSEGPNNLIKMGAIPVTKVEDILDHLGLVKAENTQAYQPGSEPEAKIYELLSQEPKQVDDLIRESKLPTAEVTSTLTLMEMKGSARHLGGQYYVRG